MTRAPFEVVAAKANAPTTYIDAQVGRAKVTTNKTGAPV